MKISDKTTEGQKKKQSRLEPLKSSSSKAVKYQMRLFVAGKERNSVIAERNINNICSTYLEGDFKLELVDVFKDFSSAIEENILVTPALVIDKPEKVVIFGNLQEEEKVLAALGQL